VDLSAAQLVIRAAKGGKDRVVPVPRSVLTDLGEQIESARMVWQRDQRQRLPVAQPHQLAAKYPRAGFEWNWAWLFPAAQPCGDPRTGQPVRWRLHEVNLHRACKPGSLFVWFVPYVVDPGLRVQVNFQVALGSGFLRSFRHETLPSGGTIPVSHRDAAIRHRFSLRASSRRRHGGGGEQVPRLARCRAESQGAVRLQGG
jgi:hypothetical protein